MRIFFKNGICVLSTMQIIFVCAVLKNFSPPLVPLPVDKDGETHFRSSELSDTEDSDSDMANM